MPGGMGQFNAYSMPSLMRCLEGSLDEDRLVIP
jgi:hypothetical protein